MAGTGSGTAVMTGPVKAHLLVIEARYHEAVADELLAGAVLEIEAMGATYERFTVPGALEIPQVLASATIYGLMEPDGDDPRFDGVVALGCVIRGETTHYETVADESNRCLMDLALLHAIPVGNAILTVETEAQAMERARGGRKGKGGDAVRACLTLVVHARALQELSE